MHTQLSVVFSYYSSNIYRIYSDIPRFILILVIYVFFFFLAVLLQIIHFTDLFKEPIISCISFLYCCPAFNFTAIFAFIFIILSSPCFGFILFIVFCIWDERFDKIFFPSYKCTHLILYMSISVSLYLWLTNLDVTFSFSFRSTFCFWLFWDSPFEHGLSNGMLF